MRGYERLLHSGATIEELVQWLGEPMRDCGRSVDGSDDINAGELIWDCLSFERTYREFRELMQKAAIVVDPLQLGGTISEIHLLARCVAAPVNGMWVIRWQCLKHMVETLEDAATEKNR